jgi:ABC-type lipoprotein release transport system permease subunit
MNMRDQLLDRFIEDPTNFSIIAALMIGIAGVIVVIAIDSVIESFRRERGLRSPSEANASASDERTHR